MWQQGASKGHVVNATKKLIRTVDNNGQNCVHKYWTDDEFYKPVLSAEAERRNGLECR